MTVSSQKCRRCGKGLVGPTCPFCTVTGVDLEALINAEEIMNQLAEPGPIALVDLVSGRPYSVTVPVCKIGRDLGNDIAFTGDRSMSRFHFQIRQDGEEFQIEDMGSRNGTFVNGSPIAIPRKLQDGDIVSVGISRYRFSIKNSLENEPGGQDGTDGSALLASQATEALQALKNNTLSAPVETLDLDEQKAIAEAQEEAFSHREFQNEDFPESREFTESAGDSSAESGEAKPKTQTATQEKPEEPPLLSSARQEAAPIPGTRSTDQNAPDWLDDGTVTELQKLIAERERLKILLEEVKHDIKQLDRKIASLQGVSQAILSGRGLELSQASKQILDSLDFSCEPANNNPLELCLKRGQKIEAVLRIVLCEQDPTPKDFEALVNQQAVVWCQFNYEPKGIMLVQSSPDKSPGLRPAMSSNFLENMRRKKICVIQTPQLLAIYRSLVLHGQDRAQLKDLLLSTCGQIQGFGARPGETQLGSA